MATLIPTDETNETVELTEEQKLIQLKKSELVEMIQAQNLKYKKLQTKNKNTNSELNEVNSTIEEAAETIQKLTESLNLANDEAAQLSNTLLMKNRTSKEINEIVLDMIQALDLTLRTSMKLLEANGLVGGVK